MLRNRRPGETVDLILLPDVDKILNCDILGFEILMYLGTSKPLAGRIQCCQSLCGST